MESDGLESVELSGKAKTQTKYEEAVSIIRECEELFKLQKKSIISIAYRKIVCHKNKETFSK